MTQTRLRFIMAALLVAAPSGTTLAQQESCRIRSVAVNILTDDGQFVDGLSAANFRAKIPRRAIEISSVNRASGQHRIAIVLDASGSMAEFWKLGVSAAEGIMNADPQSSFAFITTSNRVEVRAGLTEPREKLSSELAGIELPTRKRPYGGSGVYDGIAAALKLLSPTQFGDAIFLISDGGDNASDTSRDQLRRQLTASGVRLFALIPAANLGPNRAIITNDGSGWVQGTAIQTGGDFRVFQLGVDSPPAYSLKPNVLVPIAESGQKIMEFATKGFDREITEYYQLTIKLGESLDKTSELQLEVVDPDGTRNRHRVILYPHHLMACP